jgi:hypothetical protein
MEPEQYREESYLEEIHLRILRVTEDLRVIQRELNCAAMEATNDPELLEAITQWPQMEPLQVLRSALDQMRHFLWFYVQVMGNEAESEKIRESIRQNPVMDAAFDPENVADRLRHATDTVMLHYLMDGKNRKPN